MGAKEYVHALGEQLEVASDADLRVQLARMLGASGSDDAQPYLLDAMAEETRDDVRAALRAALTQLAEGGDA